MPTIEVISVNSTGVKLNQGDFDVAVIEENKLLSHRGLFYDFLLKQQGTVIHIGNPDFRNHKDRGYFAGKIINWDFASETNFQFRQENKDDIKRILHAAMDKSPDHKVYFLTDYQFGPETAEFRTVGNLLTLWEQHDNVGLTWNTLCQLNEK